MKKVNFGGYRAHDFSLGLKVDGDLIRTVDTCIVTVINGDKIRRVIFQDDLNDTPLSLNDCLELIDCIELDLNVTVAIDTYRRGVIYRYFACEKEWYIHGITEGFV